MGIVVKAPPKDLPPDTEVTQELLTGEVVKHQFNSKIFQYKMRLFQERGNNDDGHQKELAAFLTGQGVFCEAQDTLAIPENLRYNSSRRHPFKKRQDPRECGLVTSYYPTIEGVVTDRRGERIGVQCLFLKDEKALEFEDGPDEEKTISVPKEMAIGSAIRLGEPTDELAVCIGLIKGIHIQYAEEIPVWICDSLQAVYDLDLPSLHRLELWLDHSGVTDDVVERMAKKFLASCTELEIAVLDENGEKVWHLFSADDEPHDFQGEGEFDDPVISSAGEGEEGQADLTEEAQPLSAVVAEPEAVTRGLEELIPSCGQESMPIVRAIEPAPDRPEIEVTDYDLIRITKEAWKALEAANKPTPQLFLDGNDRVGLLRQHVGSSRVFLAAPLNMETKRHLLLRVARWTKSCSNDPGKKNVVPDPTIIGDIFVVPSPRLPQLKRIASFPFFGADGSLHSTPGYMTETKTMLILPEEMPLYAVNEAPNQEEIRAAVAVIDELLDGFVFAGEADKAHAVAMLILFLVKPMIGGRTPLHVFDSPVPGSGKTTLATSIIEAITGADTHLSGLKERDAEVGKELTAQLMGLPEYILFDNIGHRVDSPELAAVLTSPVRRDRELGKSHELSLSCDIVWIATGNNVAMSRELLRRSVWVRLEPEQDGLWRKKADDYPHPDLKGWVRENRPKVLWAGLTLIRAWIVAGRPGPTDGRNLASFAEWSATIGGILEVAGIPGFLENQTEHAESGDPKQEGLDTLVHAWTEKFGNKEVLAADLMGLVEELGLPLTISGYSLRERATNLGLMLNGIKGRQFGEVVVSAGGRRGGRRLWVLRPKK